MRLFYYRHKLYSPVELFEISVKLAEQACKEGTFGVGGLLVTQDGRIIKTFKNKVIVNGIVHDPSAHVERQILTWYYEQKNAGNNLPPLSELRVVSSLDPCMMCAGSVLITARLAGTHLTFIKLPDQKEPRFSCHVVAADRLAGVNHEASTGNHGFDSSRKFGPIPERHLNLARSTFVYAEVPLCKRWKLRELQERSAQALYQSLNNVRLTVNQGVVEKPEDLLIAEKPDLELMFPNGIYDFVCTGEDFLNRQYVNQEGSNNYGNIGEILLNNALKAFEEGRSNTIDAAALIDPFGKVLMVSTGTEKAIPHYTALANLMKEYSRRRVHIETERPDLKEYFPPLKFCKILTLQGPGESLASISDIGLFGSHMEGPTGENMASHWNYILPVQSQDSLDEMIEKFPPFYSQFVKIKISAADDPLASRIGESIQGALQVPRHGLSAG